MLPLWIISHVENEVFIAFGFNGYAEISRNRNALTWFYM